MKLMVSFVFVAVFHLVVYFHIEFPFLSLNSLADSRCSSFTLFVSSRLFRK